MANTTRRQQAIARRRAFIAIIAVLLIGLVAALFFFLKHLQGNKPDNESSVPSSSDTSDISSNPTESNPDGSSEPSSDTSKFVASNGTELDPTYERLLLVNASHTLPEDFNYTGNLTTMEAKYLNGELTQIDKDVFPYLIAMIDAARAENVMLYVRSPFRSYNTQKMLFDNQVARQIQNGTPADQAEAKAATVVARPGTSEHHTGLAVDFNSTSESFANTEMFTWLQAHAAEYGFIMRYAADKQDITGVIYEPWHYRFVGINKAKAINASGKCLEEYLGQN